jgi:hypothetical protein
MPGISPVAIRSGVTFVTAGTPHPTVSKIARIAAARITADAWPTEPIIRPEVAFLYLSAMPKTVFSARITF